MLLHLLLPLQHHYTSRHSWLFLSCHLLHFLLFQPFLYIGQTRCCMIDRKLDLEMIFKFHINFRSTGHSLQHLSVFILSLQRPSWLLPLLSTAINLPSLLFCATWVQCPSSLHLTPLLPSTDTFLSSLLPILLYALHLTPILPSILPPSLFVDTTLAPTPQLYPAYIPIPHPPSSPSYHTQPPLPTLHQWVYICLFLLFLWF